MVHTPDIINQINSLILLRKWLNCVWEGDGLSVDNATRMKQVVGSLGDEMTIAERAFKAAEMPQQLGEEPDHRVGQVLSMSGEEYRAVEFIVENIWRRANGMPERRDDGYPDGFIGPPEDIKF